MFKFTLVDDELYRRTTDDLLLKYLSPDQARLVMTEVREGISEFVKRINRLV
jgi:hypothetical protein